MSKQLGLYKSRIMKGILPNLSPIKKMGSLSCPDCDVMMTPYSCQNVIIDKCDLCNGIWFEQGEFGVFKNTLDSVDLSNIHEIYKPFDSDTIYISSCPKCKIPLYDINYSYNSKVKIRKCDKCFGQWLPHYQVLSLIELAKISQAIAPDVKGLAAELKLYERDRLKNEKLKKMGEQLNQRIPFWRYYIARYFIIFLPLYDENKRSIFPIGTIGLIAINIFVFLLMLSAGVPFVQWHQAFALQPGEIIKLDSLHTLVTSMFMHGGVMHLLGNMFFLWTFGDNVEEKFGFNKYILLYVLCGLFASAAQILSAPDSMIPVLGASGAISGVMGAYIVLFPNVNIKTIVLGYIIDLPTWIYLGFWISTQIFWAALFSELGGNGGVAWWAHIGGFVTGLLMAYVSKRSR